MSSRFHQQTVWISGAARGIGRALVLELIREGAHVVFGDRDTDGLKETVALAEAIRPDHVAAAQCDFSQPDAWDALEAVMPAHFPPLHGLIHNAGINPGQPFSDTTAEQYETTLAVNQHAAWYGIRKALPSLRQNRGAILLINSIMFESTTAKASAYTASKGALAGMARSLAVELAADGVRVNSVLPGYIMLEPPDFYRSRVPAALWGRFNDAFHSEWEPFFQNAQPLRTAGTPREIARAGVFLLSADAAFITGVELPVDGGISRVGLFYNPMLCKQFPWTDAMEAWLADQLKMSGRLSR